MDRDAVRARIKAYLEKEHPRRGARLTEATDLMEEWFADSLAVVETVLFLEKAFGVRFASADITPKSFKNLGTLADLVGARLPR